VSEHESTIISGNKICAIENLV